jgi:type IV pilus biogenesis protein CpaD/CtpE
MPRARVALLVTFAAYLAACATVDQKFHDDAWYQKTKVISAKAVDVTTTTASKAYARTQKYLAEQDLLKTFQDAGEHSEAAVLGVLHKSGISKGSGAPSSAANVPSPNAAAGPKPAPCAGPWMPTSSAPNSALAGGRLTKGWIWPPTWVNLCMPSRMAKSSTRGTACAATAMW